MTWTDGVIRYPDDVVARYRAAGAWGTRPIAAEFRSIAERFGDRDAVVAPDGRLTYRELDGRADRLALGLVELGLAPGDRVVLQIGNRLASVVAWYGLLKAGLVPVCTLTAHREYEIRAIAGKTGAAAHLVEAGGRFDLVEFARRLGIGTLLRLDALPSGNDDALARKVVDRIQSSLDPDGVAAFQLSGGTTGVPKVIPRLHAEYWYNARAYAEASGWDETTRNGHLIPIVHNAGIVCGVHAPHSVGGCLVLTSPGLDEALPLLAAERATDVLFGHGHYGAVAHPAFPAVVPSLRRVVLSGAKVPLPLFSALEAFGVWAGQLFGMGEGFFALSASGAPREARLTTVGTPISPLDEFRVLDPSSETVVPDGEVGELACRGPYTLRGYYDAPEINTVAFTSDGFYRTGDLVAVRTFGPERALSIEGRLKDIINRGGEKISAEEVEVLVLRHPAIREAAIVAMPDERLGERSCAYLVGSEVSLPDLQVFLEGLGVAKFKWPERLEWVPALPKTAVGKLDKKALARRIAAAVESERIVGGGS
ncbi:(2,3-dihydroxybenzoyl)adenylate synthase [Cryptosporangium phraense]|uniref:(2,3-dihydroxybenzoyl)adenylate synthase n=1 Tax=Cryptosporangium phraense TaxID=2593070 RepID=A0A545AV62_9ACTN|nr:AMP-binding protein [Cryptosporangium phraense]TQS45216.1 (2,3-dihydroxybenzoyl)adenylate synthase [Cryptosporangium phraense]